MENKIKTVGDLRKFLTEQGGEVKMGSVKIKCEGEGSDVDFYWGESTLMQWIASGRGEECELDETTTFNIMHEFGKSIPMLEKPEEKPDPVEVSAEAPAIDEGMIEGFKRQGAADIMEKILMGRKVTLENN